ncbi:MAG: CHAT domain-containing protein, partial [Anaerolineae bacterium]|nr:CHAT domain-containing protein [Anaerolineae bacterium]
MPIVTPGLRPSYGTSWILWRGKNITGGELPAEAIQRVGRRLFEVLFGSDIAVAFGAARAMQKDKGLRLRLEIVPPGLSALPWETMHDANGWLSTRGDTPLVRRFPASADVLYPSSLQISPPLRILFVGASPANNTPIDIEAIAARLAGEEVLGKLIARKVVSFETLLHSTTDALLDKLAEDFHAIVFVCHGGFDETDGLQRPVIFLEDEDGDRSPLPAKGHLTDWLREKPTRLVLVAACNTAANTDETGVLLRSFAQELCETVPAVIAMQYSVSDLVAPAFVEQYLHLLAAFRPADVAIAEARQSLILPPYQAGRDVFAPVMYLQTDDGALFRKARNWTRIALLAILPLFLVLTGVTAGILR